MAEYKPTPQDKIVAIARGDADVVDSLSASDISELGAEIVRHRRAAEHESRRTLEVRKLRWAIETITAKTEDLADIESIMAENAVAARIAAAYQDRGPCSEHTDTAEIAKWIAEGRWR